MTKRGAENSTSAGAESGRLGLNTMAILRDPNGLTFGVMTRA